MDFKLIEKEGGERGQAKEKEKRRPRRRRLLLLLMLMANTFVPFKCRLRRGPERCADPLCCLRGIHPASTFFFNAAKGQSILKTSLSSQND